jgi:lysophospholipase L1-like esterase
MQRPAAFTVLSALALAACGGSSSSTSPRDTGGGVEAGVAESGGPGTTNPLTSDSGSDAGTDAAPSPPKSAPLTSMGTLVVLGDSISQGGGQPPFYYNLLLSNDDTTYPEWAGKDVRTKYGANVMMVDNAVVGAVSQDLPTQVTALPSSLPGPVAVVITMGGNDMQTNIAAILQGVDQNVRTQFGVNLDTALGQLTMPGRFGAGVEVHVYEADIYDPSDGSGNFQTCPYPLSLVPPQPSDPFFGEWNAVVDSEVPKYSGAVAPLHSTFHTHGLSSGAANWFYTDCIHPNAKGHDAIRGMFWTQITGEVGPQPM